MMSKRASGKVVIVSQYYAPDPTTTATYLTAIADGLKTDCEVLVISGTAHSASAETAKLRVVEVSTWAPEKDALARRALAMALVSIKMFFATLKYATRNDVVLSVTAPFALPYSVTLAAKLRGASATLLIHDLYPEALVMAGLMQPESLVVKTIRFANRLLFGALDAIITIGRDVEPLLLTYRNVESHKIKLIPNWVLLPIGYREITSDNSFRRRFTDKMVVGLSGNLGFTHSTATVYEAARLLKGEKNIHFLLSGSGAGWKQLTELLARAPLNNVTLVDRVPQSELAEFLSAADVWIIPYRRNVAGVSVPSRIYNLFAVGRPVIVTAEASSEAALMLKEEDIGWVTRPEDPLDLAEAIRSAAAHPEETQAKGRRAALAAQRFTYDRAIASYRQVISDVMHANR
ncbi:Glycosyltransferase involved in cell wall bisynthesis [Bradyrhizobium erythrophlei]|nr:Glycosyltransferase involved in cell wall bisynthesis [Bradyrhizobium erythrophlei]